MTNSETYEKLWREHDMHILQSDAWYRVETEADVYVIQNTPTLAVIKKPRFCKPYVEVLRPAFDGFDCGEWAEELITLITRDHPEISHIHIEPNGIFSNWPSQFEPVVGGTQLAQHTCLNDLADNEDDILSGASKSHRQNIRKGIKNGLQTEVFTSDDSGFNRFIDVMRSISTSNSFSQYSEARYLKVWKELSSENKALIVVGTYQGQDIGAYLIAHSDTTAWQLYGGRTQTGRDLKLAQALAFKAMLAAKERGVKTYDMWGIGAFTEDGPDESDELYGIGQFKLAFGGTPYKHGDAMVYIHNASAYSQHKRIKKLRNLKLRLSKRFS